MVKQLVALAILFLISCRPAVKVATPSDDEEETVKTDEELQELLDSCDLVIIGRVEKVEVDPKKPNSRNEHPPEWHLARVRVLNILKGQSPVHLTLIFAASESEVWISWPKFKVGQRSIFILGRCKKDLCTAFNPLQVQPLENLSKIRKMLE